MPMNRSELEKYITEHYNAQADHPWLSDPDFAVFRHGDNRKWFALIMDVSRSKLGLQGEEKLDVVNLKCDPVMAASLRGEPGIFPAYHMNKEHWITLALDGSVPDDTVKLLLDISYNATASKTKRRI